MYQGCRLHFNIVRTALFTGKSNWLSNPRSEVCDLPIGPIIPSDELWISGKKCQSKMDVYMCIRVFWNPNFILLGSIFAKKYNSAWVQVQDEVCHIFFGEVTAINYRNWNWKVRLKISDILHCVKHVILLMV